MKFYRAISKALHARINCEGTGNDAWRDRHEERIEALTRETLPSGGGFDAGTKIDLDSSNPEKLVFLTSFHHMNDGGYYDGWTEHKITVRASLEWGFCFSITGRNRNSIKDYIRDVFDSALSSEVTEP